MSGLAALLSRGREKSRLGRANLDNLFARLPSFDFINRSISREPSTIIIMASVKVELNELFAIHPVTELPPDVMGELQSMLRLHSITPQELRYKWESYSMKMGMDQSSLDLGTARALKKDLQEMLERDSRGKAHIRSVDKRGAFATPRAAKGDDVFGMLVQKARSPHDELTLQGLMALSRTLPPSGPRPVRPNAKLPSKLPPGRSLREVMV